MKPKEYVEQFALNSSSPDIDGAMNQLRQDFQAQFEFMDLNGKMNVTQFDNIERQIKDKYTGIRNKAATNLFTDELWETFKKRVCNKVRGIRFKDYYDARHRKWQERNAWRKQEVDDMRNMFRGMLFGAIRAQLAAEEDIFVRSDRIQLGINPNTALTRDMIMDAWRSKIRDVHTDKVATASVDDFQVIMKARDILMERACA